MKCDGTRAETRFRLSAKRTSPFKSAGGASVQSTTGSRGVPISGSNAGYTMFRGSMKGTGYPLHSPVSPSLPHPCVTVCHHVSTGVYQPLKLPTPMEKVGDPNQDRNETLHLIRIKKSPNHSVPPFILHSSSFSLSIDVSFFHYLCFISFRVSNHVGRAPNWDS